MTLAVIADVHGNLTALDAVVEDIDRRGITTVVHAGDLALIGARPAEVVDRVSGLGWPGVVGNADELLWRPAVLGEQLEAAPKLATLLRRLFEVYAPATLELLGKERLRFLRNLSPTLELGPTTVLHASPGDLWRAPAPDSTEAELSDAYESLGARLVVYGHIHRPFVRRCAFGVVANAGSVGMPWDGDPRASYLLINDTGAEIVRVPYNLDAEIDELRRSSYPDAERIATMLRSGRFEPVPR